MTPRPAPTAEQDAWLLATFGVDMRQHAALAPAAPPAAAGPHAPGTPHITHDPPGSAPAGPGGAAPAAPPNRNLSPGRHTVSVLVDRSKHPQPRLPGVEVVKLFIVQQEHVSPAAATALLKSEGWQGIPESYPIGRDNKVSFTYAVVPRHLPGAAGPAAAQAGPPGAAAGPPKPQDQTGRIIEAIKLAAGKLGGAVGAKLLELTTPANVAVLIGFIGVYVAAQVTPAGWIADGLLVGTLAVSAVMMGSELSAVIDDIRAFIGITADPNGDLDQAADHLARAVAAVGVDVLVALLLHKAGGAAKPYLKPPAGLVDVVTPDGRVIRIPADQVPKPPPKPAPGQAMMTEGAGDGAKGGPTGSGEAPKPVQYPPEVSGEASALRAKAQAAEPKLTKSVEAAAAKSGGKMVGLEYRLKTQESLAEKIANDSREANITPQQAAKGVGDAVRYTAEFSPDKLAAGAEAMLAKLQAEGNTVLKLKNTWLNPKQSYKGVNVQLRGPDGQVFELQFHTPESFRAKSVETHELYEAMRKLPKGSKEWQALDAKQFEIARRLTVPDGIERIKEIK